MGSSFLKKSRWQPKGAVGRQDDSIERAFLRLGDIIAEIADSLEKKTDISENKVRSKDTISTSQQTLDDGENKDGKCSDRA